MFDPRRIAVLLSIAAAAAGILAAAARNWTCDDAFISFRYAGNLVEGNGLVFNLGERIEGFTNLLWTLWIALGLRLGASAEAWASISGIACYATTILVLGYLHLHHCSRGARPGSEPAGPALDTAIPCAALLAAAIPDWSIFATSGLETSAFTLLGLLGYVCLATQSEDATWTTRRTVAAGMLLALAALTRPDGVLFATVGGVFVMLAGRSWHLVLAYGLAFSVIWVPANAARVWYYGDLYPNTWYAKSAWLPWYDQGARYLWLAVQKYWALGLGPLLVAMLVGLSRRKRAQLAPGAVGQGELERRSAKQVGLIGRLLAQRPGPVALAIALVIVYTFYVVRVGGDFMFARFLIPTAPFYLILLDRGLVELARGWPRAAGLRLLVVAMVAAAVCLCPWPMTGAEWRYGVVNEWAVYSPERVGGMERHADALRDAFRGLPVRVAFFGGEARVVYRSRVAVAVDGMGLTDKVVGRQPLGRQRGRPGHEKLASVEYLVDTRAVHFFLGPLGSRPLNLDDWLPRWGAGFGPTAVRVIRWDPELMTELRRRGVKVTDFLPHLDRLLAGLDQVPPAQLALTYAKLRRFYFEHVRDPARETPFRRRLGLGERP